MQLHFVQIISSLNGFELFECCCAERSGQLYVTELGRVASHFYIRHASILVFNEQLTRHMDEARVRTQCFPASAAYSRSNLPVPWQDAC